MSLNDLLQACAAKLKELWPGRKVYVGEIPQNADGAFSIKLTDVKQEQALDRRHTRTAGVQVLYFRRDRDTLAYLEWAEAMLDNFRALTCGGRVIRLINRTARDDEPGRYYQFLFDAAMNFVETAPEGEDMNGLELAETMKGD